MAHPVTDLLNARSVHVSVTLVTWWYHYINLCVICIIIARHFVVFHNLACELVGVCTVEVEQKRPENGAVYNTAVQNTTM